MSNKNKLKTEALKYHENGKPGKIQVIPTKPHATQRDLSLAYSPGVAEPCLAIEENPEDAYRYTSKGNMVAVISNGTAVLGLGDIGALASKPVMEGKGLLFKIFADIDVFDIEIDEKDPEKFVETVKKIAPTFGGINLEDIKAPEAFEIENRLKEELDIPVMHDDQHGTAIISAAALLNALEVARKEISKIRMVVNGAGAAAISCAKLYISLGVKKENILMCDSKGIISTSRKGLTRQKLEFAVETDKTTLQDAVKEADVFVGLSIGDVLSPEMLLTMSENPIVFAMANPTPEINYNLAVETRNDVIMATGRSDYPNQVNNVLGFPFIFRGALDVRATSINEEMKLAAVRAIAELAKEPVPDQVLLAYGEKNIAFGKDYIIPKPFDNRIIAKVSPAVAKAAIESGVAKQPITDWETYTEQLLDRMGSGSKTIRMLQNRAKLDPKKVVLSNGDELNVIKAAQIVKEEGIAEPVLLGSHTRITQLMDENDIELDVEIINPKHTMFDEKVAEYAQDLWEKRKRKGLNLHDATRMMTNRDYFGSMMVERGDADAFVTGYTRELTQSLKPVLEVLGKREDIEKVSSVIMVLTQKETLFLADMAVIENPSTKDLIHIALQTSRVAKLFAVQPKTAMLSYTNFSSKGDSRKVADAVKYLHEHYPELEIDGEMQADIALNPTRMKNEYPFSKLRNRANVLIFPDMNSAALSYTLLRGITDVETLGPALMGIKKPAHVMLKQASVGEIVNLITLSVIDAQMQEK
ncbi:MAG: NADP-dependent malic enzyme [Flavobacteriales bacterium]